jgi:hypothetical protein
MASTEKEARTFAKIRGYDWNSNAEFQVFYHAIWWFYLR